MVELKINTQNFWVYWILILRIHEFEKNYHKERKWYKRRFREKARKLGREEKVEDYD